MGVLGLPRDTAQTHVLANGLAQTPTQAGHVHAMHGAAREAGNGRAGGDLYATQRTADLLLLPPLPLGDGLLQAHAQTGIQSQPALSRNGPKANLHGVQCNQTERG